MKTCLIAPIPDLERFVGGAFKHHLLLDHLFDIPQWGDVYREFYQRRHRAGDFITIDNGAKEHDRGSGLAQLLARAREVHANEVVVADIRFKGRESLALSVREMYELKHHLRDEYEQAGKPQLMLVPHGESPIDWRNCFLGLMAVAEHLMVELDGPTYTFGIPYAYDHLYDDGYMQLIELAVQHVTEQRIHLLGWPRRLETLNDIARTFPTIRSIDSSRPIVYAREGLLSMDYNEYPGRPDNYFVSTTSWDAEQKVHHNIEIFKAFARDTFARDK
jgi:hypothetical protein